MDAEQEKLNLRALDLQDRHNRLVKELGELAYSLIMAKAALLSSDNELQAIDRRLVISRVQAKYWAEQAELESLDIELNCAWEEFFAYDDQAKGE